MRLADMNAGAFWIERRGNISWTVVVLGQDEKIIGRWQVLISNSLGRQFVTHWNDWERSPILSRKLR